MKIKTEHYVSLKDALQAVASQIPALAASIREDGKYKDFDKRLRWDCLWAAQRDGSLDRDFVVKVLYTYMDDTHIDTALKHVMAEIAIPETAAVPAF